MNKKKVYTAPAAEVILLAPAETLASWDWSFNSVWKSGYEGLSETNIFSAVGIINGGAGLNESIWAEDGFVIKKTN